ncbi:hypothetical protein EV401DRAFT_1896295 [Pisolithus croceorrhizus]|nr:hypothetical protein EV401DRAFT_1896295 [Pisolithus croceorrhizus]
MTPPEHPSTASSTDSIQSTASVSNAAASAPYTVLLLPWHGEKHWMSQRILVAAVSRNNNRMLTDASLHCTRPLLDEIQPTYPAQDPVAAVEVALAVQLERLRVTEALGRPRQRGVQETRCGDSCTGTEEQTDDEKGINFERHVKYTQEFFLSVCSDSSSSWVRITTPPKSTSLEDHTMRTSRASRKLLPSANDGLSGKNYLVLSQVATYRCPDWEEHGYFLALVFKCITSPRVVTAYRWLAVDVLGHMREPTECFYYEEEVVLCGYISGVSHGRSDGLRTTQAQIKEPFGGQSMLLQNTYETGQLYAVGALRLSCVGLQCIGFNNTPFWNSRGSHVGRATLDELARFHPPVDTMESVTIASLRLTERFLPLRSYCAWTLYPGRSRGRGARLSSVVLLVASPPNDIGAVDVGGSGTIDPSAIDTQMAHVGSLPKSRGEMHL